MVGVPSLVPGVDQALPDVVGAHHAGGCDEDAEGEQDHDAETLAEGELETHDEWDGEEGDFEVGDAIDYAGREGYCPLVETFRTGNEWEDPVGFDWTGRC